MVFLILKKIGIFAPNLIRTSRGDIKSPLFIVKNDVWKSSRVAGTGVGGK